jgi:hypothetical protein
MASRGRRDALPGEDLDVAGADQPRMLHTGGLGDLE